MLPTVKPELPKTTIDLPIIIHDVQVTSFGGSGTTMLLDFLRKEEAGVSADHDWGIWKHLPAPPTKDSYVIPANFRSVYLVSDPVDALLSVFRREFHMWHAFRMQSAELWPAGTQIQDHPHTASWGLQDFINLRCDCFGIER